MAEMLKPAGYGTYGVGKTLAATVAGLAANGVGARADGDTLIVEGGRGVPGGGLVATHLDHRIAMSFLILGLIIGIVLIILVHVILVVIIVTIIIIVRGGRGRRGR